MNFWNLIGLPCKKDIVNLSDRLDSVEALFTNNARSIVNDIKEDNSRQFNDIKECVNELIGKLDNKIDNLNDSNIENKEIMKNIFKQMDSKLSNLYGKNKEYSTDAIKHMEEIQKKVYAINDLIVGNKEIQLLGEKLSVIEQMMRVLWVNDILDTLENQESKISIHKK